MMLCVTFTCAIDVVETSGWNWRQMMWKSRYTSWQRKV